MLFDKLVIKIIIRFIFYLPMIVTSNKLTFVWSLSHLYKRNTEQKSETGIKIELMALEPEWQNFNLYELKFI